MVAAALPHIYHHHPPSNSPINTLYIFTTYTYSRVPLLRKASSSLPSQMIWVRILAQKSHQLLHFWTWSAHFRYGYVICMYTTSGSTNMSGLRSKKCILFRCIWKSTPAANVLLIKAYVWNNMGHEACTKMQKTCWDSICRAILTRSIACKLGFSTSFHNNVFQYHLTLLQFSVQTRSAKVVLVL